mgnify:CR=1 FL=1
MNDGTFIRPARNVELGASGEEFQNLHEFVQKARSRLNQNAWDYIVGASETETTMRRNRMALDEIAFRPRVLRNVAKVEASTELFGRRLRLPVMCELRCRLPHFWRLSLPEAVTRKRFFRLRLVLFLVAMCSTSVGAASRPARACRRGRIGG